MSGLVIKLRNIVLHPYRVLKYGKNYVRHMTVENIYNNAFLLTKLNTQVINSDTSTKPRINIAFDRLIANEFFGGKATALIIANLLAYNNDYDLRIIGKEINSAIYPEFLDTFNLHSPKNVEFIEFADVLEVHDKDVFIATAYYNAAQLLMLPILSESKIFYIMQEVETAFYDHGDTHLKVVQTMTDERVIPIINSKLLYDYFCANEYQNVIESGRYFEPAFPLITKGDHSGKNPNEKYKLFFYARPSHQRNLFFFGLKTLNEAFLQNALNPNEWEVVISNDGSTPRITFDSDVQVTRLNSMGWKEYADFIKTVDLTYSMIYTPHPSYPPIDTAAAGGVCITNKYSNKKALDNYSKNIICASLNEEEMIKAFKDANALVKDRQKVDENFAQNNIANNWEETLKNTIEYIESIVNEIVEKVGHI